MTKTVEQEKSTIKAILQEGLDNHTISKQEMDEALKLTSWTALQPILDKAQGIDPVDPAEDEERLRLAREENPLHRSDFTPSELKMLKELAPDEYRLLK